MQTPRFVFRSFLVSLLRCVALAGKVGARCVRGGCVLVFMLVGAMTMSSQGQIRGVIDDPDGFVNLRKGKSADSAVVAKVKVNEVFRFEVDEQSEWCKVTLRSGKTGWMHGSRIRLYYSEDDLPKKPKKGEGRSEIDELTRSVAKVEYSLLARKAARGDEEAQKTFFGLAEHVDGAASESYWPDVRPVVHLLGDEKLSAFLSKQPIAYVMMVRGGISGAIGLGWDPKAQQRFPKTHAFFSRRELVDWPSPDGRFAIRKVFSDPEDDRPSKVTRAELIEKATGKVLLDLTGDDIGIGRRREGSVLWAPDSKRFAYLSENLQVGQGNLFSTPPLPTTYKQTTVYQDLGEGFSKVELSPSEPPDKKDDPELKDAKTGHEFIEPVRWDGANVLVLQRHDYYEALRADQTISSFGRLWEGTMTFGAEGKGEVRWKRDRTNE
jgi:hypothetical protein